jgi:hypothetical protein
VTDRMTDAELAKACRGAEVEVIAVEG